MRECDLIRPEKQAAVDTYSVRADVKGRDCRRVHVRVGVGIAPARVIDHIVAGPARVCGSPIRLVVIAWPGRAGIGIAETMNLAELCPGALSAHARRLRVAAKE